VKVKSLTLLIPSLLILSSSLGLKKVSKMIILKSFEFSWEKHTGNQLLNAQFVRLLTLLMNMETVFLNHAENGILLANALHVTQDLDLNQRLKNLNASLTASILTRRLNQEDVELHVLMDSTSQMLNLLMTKMILNAPHVWLLDASTVLEKENAHTVIHSDILTLTQAVN